MVILGRPTNAEGISYVDVDNVNAPYSAVSLLLRLEYKRIVTISGPTNSNTGLDRLEGYRRALAEHSQRYNASLVAERDFTELATIS